MTDQSQDSGVDPELLRGFLDEAGESLESLDGKFIELEVSKEIEVIQAIFRPVHSLKGNAAFFGLTSIRQVAHELETVLDQARKGRKEIDRETTDVLLAGIDELKAMVVRVRQGQPEIEDPFALVPLIDRIRACQAHGPASTIAAAVGPLASAPLTSMAIPAPHPVPPPDAAGPFTAIVRRLPAAGEDLGESLADELILAMKKLDQLTVDEDARTGLREFLDTIQTILATLGPASILGDLIREQLPGLRQRGAWKGTGGSRSMPVVAKAADPAAIEPAATMIPGRDPAKVPAAPGKAVPVAATGQQGTGAAATEKTAVGTEAVQRKEKSYRFEKTNALNKPDEKSMRVPEAQIDQFLSYVGELLVVGDMFTHLERRLAGGVESRQITAELRRANGTFAALSDSLQRSIMQLRKVSAKQLLQKVPRLVRDVAAAKAKEIQVEIIGNDTEVDKSLVELLDAPLVHLVRNAADHGIEMPADRTAKGKSAKGSVTVSIIESDTSVVLSVIDDGGGLDLDRIKAKAVELGLVAPEATLSEQDIVNFIFASGVSTAKEITDVSGRGVGLDVVKRAIEEAGGTISIKTVRGLGSSFILSLPKGVSTQIMSGYLILSGQQTYVLPLDRIERTLQIPRTAVSTLAGGNRTVLLQNRAIPLVALHDLLGVGGEPGEASESHLVVVVTCRRKPVAMIVDRVLGVQQVVVRPIEGGMSIGSAIAGGALMGDGSVAMVLEVEQLLAA